MLIKSLFFVAIAFASKLKDVRLIETSPNERKYMTEVEILNLIQKDVTFMDVTDNKDFFSTLEDSKRFDIPKNSSYETVVRSYFDLVNMDFAYGFLNNFTAFQNRYYKSTYGLQSAEMLFEIVSSIAYYSDNSKITVDKFDHPWPQFSIIARFEGSLSPEEVVIIGAHHDSISGMDPYNSRAPGADDDGSGTATTLDAFLALAEGGFKPERTVEFHWYSAEELGLLGSQDVAAKYKKDKVNVVGMVQFDMTGYSGGSSDIGIVVDHVDDDLTKFLKMLAETYLDVDYSETKCGYACSDHASWSKAGYRTAFPFETKFDKKSPYIHSKKDTVSTLDMSRIHQFVKLAISFAVELGSQ